MNSRGVLVALGAATILGACSAQDPGQFAFSERLRGPAGDTTGAPNPTTPTNDAGGTTTPEGGVTGDPVFGTTSFALGATGPNNTGQPAKTADAAHEGDSSGKDCLQAGCHGAAGPGTPWGFAGTLYTNTAGAARVPNAEIRISGPDGTQFAKTYSDADGNFWIAAPATPIPANSRVGVRTATKTLEMTGVLGAGQGGCNQAGTCHGGAQGKVYLQ